MTAPVAAFPSVSVDALIAQARLLLAFLESGSAVPDLFQIDQLATLRALLKVAAERDKARAEYRALIEAIKDGSPFSFQEEAK